MGDSRMGNLAGLAPLLCLCSPRQEVVPGVLLGRPRGGPSTSPQQPRHPKQDAGTKKHTVGCRQPHPDPQKAPLDHQPKLLASDLCSETRPHRHRQRRRSWTASTSECDSSVSLELEEDRDLDEGQDANAAEPEPLTFRVAGHSIPKRGGPNEDSFFAATTAVGVADGVGSMAEFADFGMNSAAYAGEIMDLAKDALLSHESSSGTTGSPPTVTTRAAAALRSAESRATSYGATTATVVCLVGDSIHTASLGDSGFMLLRRRRQEGCCFEVVARSQEQQHAWNFPFQLARFPSALLSRLPPDASLDSAADCTCLEIPVHPGDLLLLFSDGVSDNLFENEIVKLIQDKVAGCHGGGGDPRDREGPPDELAVTLTEAALSRSRDTRGDTPFADSSAQHGQQHSGGKEDDITAVAAWIQKQPAS